MLFIQIETFQPQTFHQALYDTYLDFLGNIPLNPFNRDPHHECIATSTQLSGLSAEKYSSATSGACIKRISIACWSATRDILWCWEQKWSRRDQFKCCRYTGSVCVPVYVVPVLCVRACVVCSIFRFTAVTAQAYLLTRKPMFRQFSMCYAYMWMLYAFSDLILICINVNKCKSICAKVDMLWI